MSHRVIIINSSVLESETDEANPVVEASVTYRPPHSAGPREIGEMVRRITRRMDSLADAFPDE